jgi:hypothetical protein
MNTRLMLCGLAVGVVFCAIATTGRTQIFVTNFRSGTVGEYTTSGEPINPTLISGLFEPFGIAISGDKLFVKTGDLVKEYTTSGALVNQSLISGVNGRGNIAVSGQDLLVGHDHPTSDHDSVVGKYTAAGSTIDSMLINPLGGPIPDMALSGDNLFLTLVDARTIAEYTTSGALVNRNLISGLSFPQAVAISGDRLFVLNLDADVSPSPGTVSEYTLSGALVNPTLITGLVNAPTDIAVSGDNLFVLNGGNIFEGIPGSIGKYTLSGETINATLVSGLNVPTYIAVVSASVPDESPSSTLLLLGLTATFGLNPLLRRPA